MILDLMSETHIIGQLLSEFFFFCGWSALLRPSVHVLPGIGWCRACFLLFPTACWWLIHSVAITGVSVAATGNSLRGYGSLSVLLLCNHRVQSPWSQFASGAVTVSCTQPECSGLLTSCQTVDWVCRGVVVSSGPSPLGSLTVWEQGFGFQVSGAGQRLQLFAPRLGQVMCSFISWNPAVGLDPLWDHSVFL